MPQVSLLCTYKVTEDTRMLQYWLMLYALVTGITSKHPLLCTAFVLGSCTIWSMHFIGMQAVTLDHIDMCHDWLETAGSLGLSVLGVWIGITLASRDIFAGADRVEKLREILKSDPIVTSKANRSRASLHIHFVALFYKLHWIAFGSMFAALGALSMHYLGMIAMKGPFRREWSTSFLSGSVLVGTLVCFAGFWILYRPLHWKVEKSWYRNASAAVIALAVCFLHFFGMLSVTYIADSTQNIGKCDVQSVWGWKPDQLMVLCVSYAVPLVAFYIEHNISKDLRTTYRQLLDVRLSPSEFSSMMSSTSSRARTSRTRISGLRNLSLMSEDSRQTLSEKQKRWNSAYTVDAQDTIDEAVSTDEASSEIQANASIEEAPNIEDSLAEQMIENDELGVSSCESVDDDRVARRRSRRETLRAERMIENDELDVSSDESVDDDRLARRRSRRETLKAFRNKSSSLKDVMQDVSSTELDDDAPRYSSQGRRRSSRQNSTRDCNKEAALVPFQQKRLSLADVLEDKSTFESFEEQESIIDIEQGQGKHEADMDEPIAKHDRSAMQRQSFVGFVKSLSNLTPVSSFADLVQPGKESQNITSKSA